jgi:tyrosyl-tRNA synthetase
MLSFEAYKQRLETGLSFIEFNYQLLQSYDFLELYRRYGCRLQIGGDDQWGNIVAGADLIRRIEGAEVYGMTFPLVTTSDGKKRGKTEKGALFLDPSITSPYDFFQYFRNVDDGDVIDLLRKMTFISLEEIDDMERTLSGAKLNTAKECLAFELTKLVHGEDEATKALNAAKSVFVSGNADENMPTVTLAKNDFDENGKIGILDLLVKAGLCSSKREARTTVEQGAASIDKAKITDVNATVEIKDFVIVQKGKKKFVKARATT